MTAAYFINPNIIISEYKACFDMLRSTTYSSLSELEEKEISLYNEYYRCFRNLVIISMRDKRSSNMVKSLRQNHGYTYDITTKSDDVLDELMSVLFYDDYLKGSFWIKSNNPSHCVNRIKISVFHLLCTIIYKKNNQSENIISLSNILCTSTDGENLVIEDTLQDPDVNITKYIEDKETMSEALGFSRELCKYFIKKRHIDRLLGYLFILIQEYHADDSECYKNNLLSEMINKKGYKYTLLYLSELVRASFGLDISIDLSDANINDMIKISAENVTRSNIEHWKDRAKDDALKLRK